MIKKLLLLWCLVCSFAHAQEGRVITVASEVFPPYQYMENGQMVGPMVVIMQKACAAAKLQCNFVMLPWVQALQGAENGDYEVLFSILDSPVRRDKFVMGPPMVASAYAAFVLSRNPWVYSSPASLKGLTIAAYGPSGTSFVAQELAAQGGATVDVNKTMLESFQRLVEGAYGPDGVVIANRDVGQYLMRQNGVSGPKPAGVVRYASYTFGVSRKARDPWVIHHLLSSALRDLHASGVVESVMQAGGLTPSKVTNVQTVP